MQVSSTDFITVTNECGVSGEFMKLARNGQLMLVSEVILGRSRVARELAEVEEKLLSCNNAAWLARFAKRCSTRNGDFSSRLRQLAAKLEARRSHLLANLRESEQQVNREDWGVEWAVAPTSMTRVGSHRARESNPSLVKRNTIIDQDFSLPTEQICKILDGSARADEVIDWIPRTWARDYGVETFLQAYRHPQCRKRVHKMISLRRRLRRDYP